MKQTKKNSRAAVAALKPINTNQAIELADAVDILMSKYGKEYTLGEAAALLTNHLHAIPDNRRAVAVNLDINILIDPVTHRVTTDVSDTSSTRSEETSDDPIAFVDEPNAVTIRIKDRAFENLKEIAAIFNKWDNGNNTPADIAERFMCEDDYWGCLDKKIPEYPQETLVARICDKYHSCRDVKELKQAFAAEGFFIGG